MQRAQQQLCKDCFTADHCVEQIFYSSIGEMSKDEYRGMLSELLQMHAKANADEAHANANADEANANANADEAHAEKANANGQSDQPASKNQESVLLIG